jgi:hypothetical protein
MTDGGFLPISIRGTQQVRQRIQAIAWSHDQAS